MLVNNTSHIYLYYSQRLPECQVALWPFFKPRCRRISQTQSLTEGIQGARKGRQLGSLRGTVVL